MRYVLVLQNNSVPPSFDALSQGDSVTILVAPDHRAAATEADRDLSLVRAEAERLQQRLSSKGVDAKVVVEWGDMAHALENCLRREEAVLLK